MQVNSYQNTNTKESVTLDYVTCLMKTALNFKDSIFPGSKCARDLQLPNWHIIEECANTTQGSKLLQKYGEMTSMLAKPINVPVITFDHVSFELDFCYRSFDRKSILIEDSICHSFKLAF